MAHRARMGPASAPGQGRGQTLPACKRPPAPLSRRYPARARPSWREQLLSAEARPEEARRGAAAAGAPEDSAAKYCDCLRQHVTRAGCYSAATEYVEGLHEGSAWRSVSVGL